MELNEKTLKNILTNQRKEYECYIGAVNEDTQDKVSAVAEQLVGVNKNLDSVNKTLDSHTEIIGSMKEDIEVIKTNIGFIKGDLKKKIDYEEFEVLEKKTVSA